MTSKPRIPAMALLDRVGAATLAAYDRDRHDAPHRFTSSPDGLGPDFLFVENVARLLACNVDHVRRIPRADLPASKVGNRLIYARADVEAYIKGRRNDGASRHVANRKLQRVAPKSEPQNATFDPVALARKLSPKAPKS